MKNKKYLSGKFAYLKSQAEKLIAKDAITMPAKLPENMQEILYELFTHQIELELQNEELRQTQEKLSKSQKNFSDLYDFAPVGYMSISDKGLIVEANLCSADMLAIERGRLIKQSLSNFIVAEDQDLYYLVRKKLLESKKSQTCELRIRRKNESLFDANLKAAISSDIDGSSGQFRIILTDISEQKKKDGLLRKEIEEHQNNK
ncbi:MAG: PAS domain-containing protein, partial [Gammaproteobacteria bacterium]|nr:PAS domain-containing protein [Gammaproteobacteria bacterium]